MNGVVSLIAFKDKKASDSFLFRFGYYVSLIPHLFCLFYSHRNTMT
jgi:hypothetical protein